MKSRYVALAPWLLVLAAILFLLEVFERRTGWVSKFLLGRKPLPADSATESAAEAVSSAKPLRKPGLPWLVRKRPLAPVVRVTAKANPSAPASVAPSEPKPAPEKTVTTESAIDALRKARERAKSRIDKER